MPPKKSAGLLVYRRGPRGVEVLLGHMGGPYWERKDAGAWSVPKGEYGDDEQPLAAARREFEEELGLPPPDGTLLDLGAATQSSGKVVVIWAVEGDLDPADVVPGTFEMEWPPGTGRRAEFPEIDRAAWFGLGAAREALVAGQRPFVDRLAELLTRRVPDVRPGVAGT
jgi:predicted NUDIX family NTP pyrophosphohydrolase